MNARALAFVRDGLASQVCIVHAPAGWGKTTVARTALETTNHCWIDLGTAGGESGLLYWELSRALGLPSDGLSGVPCDAFLETIPEIDATIAIDDVQKIAHDARSLDLLQTLIERRKDLRFVLIGREELPLPIATWLAQGIAALPITQNDLALDDAHVRDMLAESNLRADDRTVETVMRCTGGWPVAVRFSMMALRRTAELARVEAISRELACKYLAEQIVFDLSDEQRSLLRDLAIAGHFDETLIAALGIDNAHEKAEWLARAAIPLHRSPTHTRLHDVLSAFLVDQMPPEERTKRAARVAEVVATMRSENEALDILRAHAPQALTAFLERHGLALLRSGRRESLRAAIDAIPGATKRDNPAILMIRGSLEYSAGNFDRAKQLADRAIERADPESELFVELMRWRATLNCYEPREKALAWLERVTASASERTMREIRGPLAILLAMMGEFDRARADIAAVIDAAERAEDEPMQRAALSWAMSIEVNAGDLQRMHAFATRAMEIHERTGDLRGITIVRNTLAGAQVVLADDRTEALHAALRYRDAALRWGDAGNIKTAAAYLYQLAVESCDDDTVRQIEAGLPDSDTAFPGTNVHRIARAIRLGWTGDFAAAVRVLVALEHRLSDAVERRNWQAATAMFLAFGNEIEAATQRLAHMERAVDATNAIAQRERRMADIYLAYAELFIGRYAAAKRHFPAPQRDDEAALVEAGMEIAQLGAHATPSGVKPILERLAERGQRGFARTLNAAVALRARNNVDFGLTEAELRVLRDLAAGRSPQQIAADSGRSVETVRNQVKSAIRKLGVSGRLEAVAAARSAGLV